MQWPLNRGTSVLAALVFVGILGAVAYGVSAVGPHTVVQSQAAAATASSKDSVTLGGASRCVSPIEEKKSKESSSSSESNGVNNVCVKGCEYKVQRDTGDIDSKDVCADLPSDTVTQQQVKKNCETTRQCVVRICSGSSCGAPISGSSADTELGKAAHIPSYYKDSKEVLAALDKLRGGQDAASVVKDLPPYMQDAFNEAKADAQEQLESQLVDNQTQQHLLEQRLENAANYGSNDRVIAEIQGEKDALQAKEAQLQQQLNNLHNVQLIGADRSDLSADANKPSIWDQPGVTCTNGNCPITPNQTPIFSDKPVFSDPSKTPTSPGGSPGPRTGAAPQQPRSIFGGGGSGGFLNSMMQGLLRGFAGGLMSGIGQGSGPACASDPNAYAQQQQQYNAQLQQYQLQIQQYQMQQQLGRLYGYPTPPALPPQPPQPCRQTSDSNSCPAAPQRPPESNCGTGEWRPVTTQLSNGHQCTTSWQCVPVTSTPPTAQLSCQPEVADVGMQVAISFSCGGATQSAGSGFDTQGKLSGSATTVIAAPPAGAAAQNFGLKCTNRQGVAAHAQCKVQIGKASIVLVASPNVVHSGEPSTIGWITSGMQECVVSSADLPEFTAENVANKSINGMATTSPLTASAEFLLHCTTVAGGTRDATTSVEVVEEENTD